MKYLVTSDIHLGHTKTPTEHIITSFKQSILTKENQDASILFISGDLFDSLLDLNNKDLHRIVDFFNYLLSYCTENNILLRVLEGTPSHDWKQSELLVNLNNIRTHKCSLAYFKQLDIEHIPSLNKYILYIPDEWCHDHTELQKQIQTKLLQHGIASVDIAILHGQFQYQTLGKKYSGFYFQEEYFLSIVTGYIHIGHYHTYSNLKRIIANGSLERLAHGEESPKGYVVVNNDKFSFIENRNAYTYKTIIVTQATTLQKLDSLVYSLPKNSHIRFVISSDHIYSINFSELKLRYLDYNCKKLIKNEEAEDSSITYILTEDDIDTSKDYVIDGNIYEKLIETVLSKYELNSNELKKLNAFIEPLKLFSNQPEESV